MKIIDKVGKAIITQWVDGSEYGWPPDCTGFVYQPERPAEKTYAEVNSNGGYPNERETADNNK